MSLAVQAMLWSAPAHTLKMRRLGETACVLEQKDRCPLVFRDQRKAEALVEVASAIVCIHQRFHRVTHVIDRYTINSVRIHSSIHSCQMCPPTR
jgi:hypothetical protein